MADLAQKTILTGLATAVAVRDAPTWAVHQGFRFARQGTVADTSTPHPKEPERWPVPVEVATWQEPGRPQIVALWQEGRSPLTCQRRNQDPSGGLLSTKARANIPAHAPD